MNKNLVDYLKVNKWKDMMLLTGFMQLKTNSFIQLDIVQFQPGITESILDTAISFARHHTDISGKNLTIIKHCCKPLL